MPPTTPTDSAMCSLCPRSKKAQHPKKLVRFDSVVDTFSITDSGTTNNRRSRREEKGKEDNDRLRENSRSFEQPTLCRSRVFEESSEVLLRWKLILCQEDYV
uniref:Uncharacterized protein n=1 Tax=Vespula pensylvanica TaxID=30213 RepID=A0A834PDE9_VESPE|nr:hypothetical protein H0235_000134 [Vespula pensylvanica]